MLVLAPPLKISIVPAATPMPVTFVTSSSVPPFKRRDDAGRGGDERDGVVAAGGRVEREGRAGPSDGVGMLTTPMMPAGVRRTGRVECHEVLVGDVGRLEGRRRRRPACWRTGRVGSRGPVGPSCARERLVVGEVVEGVVDRRGRVGDRLEAGVVEAGGRSPPASVKKIEPYWPTCGKTVGSLALWVSLANGPVGSSPKMLRAWVTPAGRTVPDRPSALKIRPGEPTVGIGLPPPPKSRFKVWSCSRVGVDGQRGEGGRDVGDIVRHVPELVVQRAGRAVAGQVQVVGETIGREVDDQVCGAREPRRR